MILITPLTITLYTPHSPHHHTVHTSLSPPSHCIHLSLSPPSHCTHLSLPTITLYTSVTLPAIKLYTPLSPHHHTAHTSQSPQHHSLSHNLVVSYFRHLKYLKRQLSLSPCSLLLYIQQLHDTMYECATYKDVEGVFWELCVGVLKIGENS